MAELGMDVGPNAHIVPGWGDGRRMTVHQQHNWPEDYLKPARLAIADAHPEFEYLRKATPLSLRRGAISARLASGEDEAHVARECATSVQMLRRHYRRELRPTRRVYETHTERVLAARQQLGTENIWKVR